MLPGVPIFNYHGLAESVPQEASPAARKYWLSPTQFRSQLAHIRQEGFHVALLDELKDRAVSPVPKSPVVVVTFDDGLVTDYEIAFPLLAEFGQRAVFFLNTSTIGRTGYLTWAQVAEMQRNGMSIQSHGHRHVDLTVLPSLVLESELIESKHRLEDRLGSQVDFLAAPHGISGSTGSPSRARSRISRGLQHALLARASRAPPYSRGLRYVETFESRNFMVS